MTASSLILVLNCGSSSIKFALYDAEASPMPRRAEWNGKVDGITGPNPTFGETGVTPGPVKLEGAAPYTAALMHIAQRVQARLDGRRLAGVAHRVVHGGAHYFEPVRVDADVLAELRSYIPLAPLHQPFALEAIGELLEHYPELPQVACFDTAFHHTLPKVEQLLPLPYSAWERGLRRYGFHGLSYEYIATVLAERDGDAARGRTIVAHLGSGASLCGMQDLKSVATTMGFSALDGLMMGSRTGALDPGAVLYLMEIEQLTLEQVGHMLYHESGLVGVSGLSSDPRVLLAAEDTNPQAHDALALYVRRIVREIGSITAALGGLDMLVFTAGIGEHNAELRRRIVEGLGYLGAKIDDSANEGQQRNLAAADSRVRLILEHTNEEWIAAQHARELI